VFDFFFPFLSLFYSPWKKKKKKISSTVSNDDLNRGKNSAKFSALAAFETQSQLAEFMGKSVFFESFLFIFSFF